MEDWVIIEKPELGWEVCNLPDSVSYTKYANPSAADSFKSEPATLWDGINIEEMTSTEARHSLLFLIRKGVPDSLRKTVWKKLMEIDNNAEHYHTEVIQRLGGFDEHLSRFPTFNSKIDLKSLNLSDAGQTALKRILSLFSLKHPELTDIPVLPCIVSLALHFFEEYEAYEMIEFMFKNSKGTRWYFYLPPVSFSNITKLFVNVLTEKYPALVPRFNTNIKATEQIISKWLNQFFIETLPRRLNFRILDCFINEGIKVIFRAGLGIIDCLKNNLQDTKDDATFFALLEKGPTQFVDEGTFMKCAFRTKFSRKTILVDTPLLTEEQHVQQEIFYKPKPDIPSAIITLDEFNLLWSFLPRRLSINDPRSIFTTEKQGFNLCTLVEHITDVFGAFLSEQPKFNKGIFGTGECFLFTIKPTFCAYHWTKKNNNFMFTDKNTIGFGLSKNGFGLLIDKEMNVYSDSTETFDNPSLTKTSNTSSPKMAECPALCIEAYLFA